MSFNEHEFEAFGAEPGDTDDFVKPPLAVGERIRARVVRDLNPSHWTIFSKLALLHFGMSLVILSFCPQFGLRIFAQGDGLASYFSKWGPYGCMLGCGAVFLGSSALLAALTLSREELRILRRSHVLAFGILGLLSLGVFAMAHAELVLGLAAAWLTGSVLASSVGFELIARVRLRSLA